MFVNNLTWPSYLTIDSLIPGPGRIEGRRTEISLLVVSGLARMRCPRKITSRPQGLLGTGRTGRDGGLGGSEMQKQKQKQKNQTILQLGGRWRS
jgi:hypothetical protein